MPDLNHAAIYARIQSHLASDLAVNDCMRDVIELCAADVPHADWPLLTAIDYDADVSALRNWIPGVFEQQRPPFPPAGLFINLCNPGTPEGEIWADMGLMATANYVAEDADCGWHWESERFYPDDALASSSALRSVYRIAFGSLNLVDRPEGKLRSSAEWPLCLAFGAIAATRLLAGRTSRVLHSQAAQLGVVVGFGDGDFIKVGTLTPDGFLPATT
jgi:hypothetical protein